MKSPFFKNPIILGLMIFSCAEAITIISLVTNSKILLDDKGYKFLTDVILVLIPTGLGAIVTYAITNAWQRKMDKNKIKLKILMEYKDYFPKIHAIIGSFYLTMYGKYVDYQNSPYNANTGLINYNLIPIDANNIPFNIYKKDCRKFIDDYFATSFKGIQFLRSLRYYLPEQSTQNNLGPNLDYTFETKNQEILTKYAMIMILCEKFMHSDNNDDFETYFKLIETKLTEIKNDTKEFEKNIRETMLTIRSD